MPRVMHLDRDIGDQSPTADQVAADLAAKQHGVVAHRQLLAAGLGKDAVHHRIRGGRLHPVHRGVYAVGHPRLTGHGRWMAAVLACPLGSVLSHRCAGSIHGLLRYSGTRIDVTTTGGKPRRGIVVHRVRRLPDEDRVLIDGVPVTSVARTLIDQARTGRADQLERMLDAAERQGVFDLRSFGGRALPRRLREAIRLYYDLGFTRSELERMLARLCIDASLPLPAMNKWIGDQEVDAVWEDQKVALLIDSWKFHGTRIAFEEDRTRFTALQLRGYRVLVVTDHRLVNSPGEVVADLRKLLAR